MKRNVGVASLVLLTAILAGPVAAAPKAKTEPKPPKDAPAYQAEPRAEDGRNLALTVQKLQEGFDPPRPFVIWAIGSSYTAGLGDGSQLIALVRQRFPGAPEIVYKRMVGNAVPFQYIRGWARHLVVPDQPDLVLIYTNGKPEDLEKLLVELRRSTTADIIVPTLHWRKREMPVWDDCDAVTDIEPPAMRALCEKYGVEFVENRREWAQYLKQNQLQIEDLLGDAVHQSAYGAKIINMNIARHIHRADRFNDDPGQRQRRVAVPSADLRMAGPWRPVDSGRGMRSAQGDASLALAFTGNRIELIGGAAPGGGTMRVWIDDKPADQVPAFTMTYVQPGSQNARTDRSPPRDCSPHGVGLGTTVVPQTWTIRMTSDQGDYELTGSVTGLDGAGNSRKPFTSDSGQIVIEPELWRNSRTNRQGDTFTFEVLRATAAEVSFASDEPKRFRVRLAQALANGPHTLKLVSTGDGPVLIEALDVFQPPLK